MFLVTSCALIGGSFWIHITLPVYELHLQGSHNTLLYCYEYRFYKLIVPGVQIREMALEKNGSF